MAGKDPGLVELEKGRKYQLRVSAGRDPLTGDYRRLNETFRGNRTEAKERLRAMRGEVASGKHTDSQGTVGYLLGYHLDAMRRRSVKPTTIAAYESAVRCHMRDALGHLRLADVGPEHLNAYYDALAAKGMSRNTIQVHYSCLSGAFTRAEKLGWITRNPVRLSDPPAAQTYNLTERAPSREEVEALVRAAADRHHAERAAFILVSALTGARLSELCGLRWRDLDAGTLTITEQISSTTGRIVRAKPKSGRGVRAFRLDVVVLGALAVHREAMVARAEAGGVELGPDAYVWSDDLDGSTPWRPQRISTWFGWLAGKVGLGHIRLHDLRHFNATELIDAGCNPALVAARLGHDPATLMRVYAAVRPMADQLAADHMGRVLAPFGLPAGG